LSHAPPPTSPLSLTTQPWTRLGVSAEDYKTFETIAINNLNKWGRYYLDDTVTPPQPITAEGLARAEPANFYIPLFWGQGKIKVINQRLYFKWYRPENKLIVFDPGFETRIQGILEALSLALSTGLLPDGLELLVNFDDVPYVERLPEHLGVGPVLSFCNSPSTTDIHFLPMIADYAVKESVVPFPAGPPFEQRKQIAFWRGSLTRDERKDLFWYSLAHPDLVDAKLLRFDNYTSPRVPYSALFNYQMLIDIEGLAWSSRYPLLLATGSTVLKIESPVQWREYWYDLIRPGEHYISVPDIAHLAEAVQWVRDHQAEAKAIATRAQEFANKYLNMKHYILRTVTFLRAYKSRMNFEPALDGDDEECPRLYLPEGGRASLPFLLRYVPGVTMPFCHWTPW